MLRRHRLLVRVLQECLLRLGEGPLYSLPRILRELRVLHNQLM
jgi:hypothetical protein